MITKRTSERNMNYSKNYEFQLKEGTSVEIKIEAKIQYVRACRQSEN